MSAPIDDRVREVVRLGVGGSLVIHHTNEAELRDGVAEILRMSGWIVSTEHHIDGWGRIDIVASSEERTVGIELKLDLNTASKCRKAAQQVDNYRRALPHFHEIALVATSFNPDLMDEYAMAYRVWPQTVSSFLVSMQGADVRDTHLRAHREFAKAKAEFERHLAILRHLSLHRGSPLGAFHDLPPVEKEPSAAATA